jgi:hypothetical protein
VNLVSEPDHTDVSRTRRKAGPIDVAKAVFWSFLGIRKRTAHEQDFVTLRPMQVIIAGLIGAVLLVLSIVTLVRFITS